ncbi:MAG TPA: hypothetical protein PLI79_25095, partial [Mycobacterium sp.]|nr:hypothetical protein [Mycobacterium sp.]
MVGSSGLGTPTAGTFSHHRFALSGGTGELDVEAGTAHVEWDGDVTVLYYSVMSMFHISDPVLDVAQHVVVDHYLDAATRAEGSAALRRT